jgi:hypothetical protein
MRAGGRLRDCTRLREGESEIRFGYEVYRERGTEVEDDSDGTER